MSLAVKCHAVKCHYGHMSQNLEVVKSPWSNVPWSNETVVIGDPIHYMYKSRGELSLSVEHTIFKFVLAIVISKNCIQGTETILGMYQ